MFFQGSCNKKFHKITRERHCMKSVQIKTFSGSYFLYLDLMRRLRSKSPYSVRIQENMDQKKRGPAKYPWCSLILTQNFTKKEIFVATRIVDSIECSRTTIANSIEYSGKATICECILELLFFIGKKIRTYCLLPHFLIMFQ